MVAGALSSPEVVPCSQVALDEPTVLVLGSEGKGLRTNVKVCFLWAAFLYCHICRLAHCHAVCEDIKVFNYRRDGEVEDWLKFSTVSAPGAAPAEPLVSKASRDHPFHAKRFWQMAS